MVLLIPLQNYVDDEQTSRVSTYISCVSLKRKSMKFSSYVEVFLHLKYNLGSTTTDFVCLKTFFVRVPAVLRWNPCIHNNWEPVINWMQFFELGFS